MCDSGATRTLDPQLRRLLLYPTELRNQNIIKNYPNLLLYPPDSYRNVSYGTFFRLQKYIIFQFLQPEF